MRKVKILYVIGTLVPGGAEKQLLNLIKLLDKTKFQPVLIALRGGKLEGDFKKVVKLRIIGKKWKIDPFFFFHLFKAIKKESPDILHTFMFTSNTWGRFCGILLKVPVLIASERSTDPWKKWYHFKIDKILGKFTSKIICVSEEVEKVYKEKLNLPDEKFLVIKNGVDIEYFDNIERKAELKQKFKIEEEKVILTGGRLSSEKGIDYFLRAAEKLIKIFPPVKFLIVGEGSEREKLEREVESMNLEEKVIFTGYRDDLPQIMKISDVVVLSSKWEGLPNLLIEAMACKLPVVATNVGGCKEIVKEGENGFLVEYGDIENLTEKILYILKNPEMSEKMGKKGYEFIKTHFNIKDKIKQYENIYLKTYFSEKE